MPTDWERQQIGTTMREMLTDRGYGGIVPREEGAAFDGETGGVIMEGVSDEGKRCLVTVHRGKLGIKTLREIGENRGDASIIVVATEKPTPPAQRHLQNHEVVEWCNVFVASEVIRNVTRHHLVPRHTRVPPSQLPSLFERWKEKDTSHLPLILVTDPVAKYLGLREGEVVHIEGPDGTQTSQFSYRRAVCPSF